MKTEKERDEGRQEGIEKVARTMLEDGLSLLQISKFTGLTEEEISSL